MMEIFFPAGLQRNGEGWKLSTRIRFVHARIRGLLANSEDWNHEAWGTPISAAHLGFAISVFSKRLLEYSKMLGAKFSREEEESVLAIWRYAGYLMGIPETILYKTGAEAEKTYKLPGAGLIFSSGNRRKWTEPPGKLLHDEVVPAQICRHRGVGLCGCEGVGNEGRLAGRRTCAEHVAVESAHGRLAVPLSPRQLVGASSAATVGPGGSLAGRWVWRLPRRIPVPHGGARPRGSRRWRRRDEDTRRGPTPRTAASCLVAFPPLAAKPTGRGLGRRRDGAD